MIKRLASSLILAPLIGLADTLPKAASFFALSVLVVVLYGAVMHVLRPRLSAPARLITGLMLAAALVSSEQVLLQAVALPLYQQLGVYLALISLQCVVLEYAGFFDPGQSKTRLRLFGLFGALLFIMGLLRERADTTLIPAGFILLGLLLAGLQAWAHYLKSR